MNRVTRRSAPHQQLKPADIDGSATIQTITNLAIALGYKATPGTQEALLVYLSDQAVTNILKCWPNISADFPTEPKNFLHIHLVLLDKINKQLKERNCF